MIYLSGGTERTGLVSMLRPSKKLVLALEAVTDIAYHGGVEPVQVRTSRAAWICRGVTWNK